MQVSRLPRSGPVAQLGARFHGMEEVVGSIPTRSTNLHSDDIFLSFRFLTLPSKLNCFDGHIQAATRAMRKHQESGRKARRLEESRGTRIAENWNGSRDESSADCASQTSRIHRLDDWHHTTMCRESSSQQKGFDILMHCFGSDLPFALNTGEGKPGGEFFSGERVRPPGKP